MLDLLGSKLGADGGGQINELTGHLYSVGPRHGALLPFRWPQKAGMSRCQASLGPSAGPRTPLGLAGSFTARAVGGSLDLLMQPVPQNSVDPHAELDLG